MATYDNKIWLLKNIRDAFIATDDTGLCEIVMAEEDFSKIFQNKAIEEKKLVREKRLSLPSTSKGKEVGMGDISESEDEREIVSQFDPYPDMEDSEEDDPIDSYIGYEGMGGHRQRTNTAQWLDKKEQALKKAAKIKLIKWEDPVPLTQEQMEENFQAMEIRKPERVRSKLADQIENCPNLPHCQYLEYAKFDGTAQLGMQTKSFKIFMTMLSEKHQNYPVVVCVIASAKIKDLIGFTCYKYSIEHPDVTLGSVQDYGLYIAEDDGEVDWAFPCLEANEPCSKFFFTCLGLNLKNRIAQAPCSISEFGPFNEFPKATEMGLRNQNPSRHNTGGSATSEAVLSALKVVNEERKAAGEAALQKINSHIIASEAPQYKAYKVQLLRKVRTNILVQLGISIDRIEVEPIGSHKHTFWQSRSKYFLHSVDSIAWCQILEAKASKTIFRIIYSPSQGGHNESITSGNTSFSRSCTYKLHDFECDHNTAREIVEKINTILDLRNSPCRREYKTAKDKKTQVRRSFHTKHMS